MTGHRQTDRQTHDRRQDRQTDRQTDRHTTGHRHTDRQTKRQTRDRTVTSSQAALMHLRDMTCEPVEMTAVLDCPSHRASVSSSAAVESVVSVYC